MKTIEACDLVLIEASKLSLNDKFMKHRPRTEKEKELKSWLEEVIKKGVKDFYRPKVYEELVPPEYVYTYYREGINYPVNSYIELKKRATAFAPYYKSRLGKKSEYVAFLGVLIKMLVKEGKTVSSAWRLVCNDYHKLGRYIDSLSKKHGFESCGIRAIICTCLDLTKVGKILTDDEDKDDGYWVVSGVFAKRSKSSPIVSMGYVSNFDYTDNGIAWLVFEGA